MSLQSTFSVAVAWFKHTFLFRSRQAFDKLGSQLHKWNFYFAVVIVEIRVHIYIQKAKRRWKRIYPQSRDELRAESQVETFQTGSVCFSLKCISAEWVDLISDYNLCEMKETSSGVIKFCTHSLFVCLFQAQIEIQSMMEENTYPLFLKSDLYLEYTRTGGESPKPNPSDQSPSSGPAKPVPGYLPTLAEDEEWR